MDAVVVRSTVCLPRFLPRLTVDFADFNAAVFCTFAAAVFLVFAGLRAGAAFGVTGVAANPLSAARMLNGALLAGLKAKVITPAATAAATTVNLCM
ncbi:hypothetical protein ABID26_003149 [Mesorhizobium shonense]|uniref:Uncharacterized protein n=1 Tax=Mesorhizobium shonense TaxID=1209948 RepID=A0ABV2HU87_9HYPH